MKFAFWLGVLLGFGGLLAGAHYWPWFAHARVPSQTSVVANGGRAETFVVRLPADRVSVLGTADAGLRAAAGAPVDGAAVLVEHFKLRDTSDNVIGVAARHWTPTPDGRAGTAWSLLVPGRGALYLAAPGEARGAVDAALRAAGYAPGSDWSGTVDVALAAGESGAVVAGSEEFQTLRGRYTEQWTVTGVDASGELRGTVRIDTVTFAEP